ncbi:MAG TPA: hypothetical protein VKC60_03015 [Opitutaceae bacterium]|nr:hypothetical protein [Opitutaceae bacterium]
MRVQGAIRKAVESLRREFPSEWLALSSIAMGADTLFVKEVLAQNLPWQAILPTPPTVFRNDFSKEDWNVASAYLGEASHVHVLSEETPTAEAFMDAGLETVDGSDVIIAFWDGQASRGRGGTADVVAYARQVKKPLIIIDAGTFNETRENFGQFRELDEDMVYLNGLSSDYEKSSTHSSKVPAKLVAFHLKTGHAATLMSPYSRTLAASTILLHVLATVVATGAIAFELHWTILPWIKLACVAGALVVALTLRHQHHHHRWILCRLACEISRAALAIWELPKAGNFFRDLELPTLKQLARSLHIMHQHTASQRKAAFDEYKASYLKNRIDDQISYYHRQEMKALPRLHALKLGFWITTIVVVLCSAGYALYSTFHIEWIPTWVKDLFFYFAPIALPAVAAAFISLISVNDLQRRVARYRVMQHTLTSAKQQFEFSQTWTSLEKVVHRVEKALLQEVLEWHALMSFSESH